MNYPQWICRECGIKYGKKECGVATWHQGQCHVCGKETNVTEPRDYGHLKEEWLGAVLDVWTTEKGD